ncbi:LCP family protein [Rathayibacter toxicus]|uniref:Transcriptional regulator n=1 Tax=Rathayibacter toxicus TaxID=145458 RepID=A0A0C5BG40_9MICO|nr:LCP family protein [Rathayibacter toxicus]AJM78024.1 transcriptional regulator [Rathayibacter toxicus]ALS57748.1 transcriptional regulator [Rathayibacter toxicus]KKM47329.1 transcriptional regulator [Rathayibacter toxicus]
MTAVALPLRHPDDQSRALMTHRAWWLLAVNFLVPGSAQVLAGNRRLGRLGLGFTLGLWIALLVGVLLFFVFPTALYTLVTVDLSMLALQVALVVYGVVWLVLTLDTLRLIRVIRVWPRARGLLACAAAVLMVVSVGTTGYGTYLLGVSRGTLSSIFGDGQVVQPVNGHYNIMLLGGDAGPDRSGLRPDSVSVVSIDASSGKAAIIGVTREFVDIPFPEGSPMRRLYPDGYNKDNCAVDVCKLNSVYTEVQLKHPDLYPDAAAKGSEPGIEATRDAVEGILGLPIQYYALIDMEGFAQLINALGGIDIDYVANKPLPLGGLPDSHGVMRGVNQWIEPGHWHFNGEQALAYSRSRYTTSDYDRMARQRQVQEALLAQFSPANVLAKFQDIAAAGAQVIKTDVPQNMLGYFVQLGLKTKSQPVTPIGLVPPDIDPEKPNYDRVHSLVQKALFPDSSK